MAISPEQTTRHRICKLLEWHDTDASLRIIAGVVAVVSEDRRGETALRHLAGMLGYTIIDLRDDWEPGIID